MLSGPMSRGVAIVSFGTRLSVAAGAAGFAGSDLAAGAEVGAAAGFAASAGFDASAGLAGVAGAEFADGVGAELAGGAGGWGAHAPRTVVAQISAARSRLGSRTDMGTLREAGGRARGT